MPGTARPPLKPLLLAVLAGMAAVWLIEFERLGQGFGVPWMWLPTLVLVVLHRRIGLRGWWAGLIGAAICRVLVADGVISALPTLAIDSLSEAVASGLMARALARQLPRGLLPVGELAVLFLRRVLPLALLAAAMQGAAEAVWIGSAPGWLVAAQFAMAQGLALSLAGLVCLDPELSSSTSRQRNLIVLAAITLTGTAALGWMPTLWLPLIALLAWLALSGDLRSLTLGLLISGLLPGLVHTLQGEPGSLPGSMQFQLALGLSAWVLMALAVEAVHREASRAQMNTLVHARTQVLQAELRRRRELEERFRDSPAYDHLTGAPNRALLLDRMSQAMADARRQDIGLAVALLELDGLQVINDACGRPAGDRALLELNDRLRRRLRGSDTVARIGGDEFVILALRAPTPAAVAEIAMRVLSELDLPLVPDARHLATAASLGIALFPRDGSDPETLLSAADAALQLVKRSGSSGWALYAGEAVPDASDADDAAPLSDSEGDPSGSNR